MALATQLTPAPDRMHSTLKNFEVSASSLLGVKFFTSLAAEQRQEVLRYCHGTVFQPKHEIVHYHGDEDDVYFIVSGRVQATIFSATGKVITFQELREGDMFGEVAAIDQSQRSASVIATTESYIVRTTGASFREMVARYPALNAALMQRLCGLVRFLSARVFEFHTLSVTDRVCAELLRLARAEGGEERRVLLSPAPTHQEISHRAGTHREAVTRVFGVLTQDGLIERSGTTLIVRDVEALGLRVERALGEPSDA